MTSTDPSQNESQAEQGSRTTPAAGLSALAPAIVRLVPPETVLFMLLRAMDPKTASPSEWESLRALAEERLPALMASSWLLSDGTARRGDTHRALAVLKDATERGEQARERFVQSFGQAHWAATALGGLSEDPLSGRGFPTTWPALEAKMNRASDFGSHLVRGTLGSMAGPHWRGWARAAVLTSLLQDLRNQNYQTPSTEKILMDIKKRDGLVDWDWQAFVRHFFEIAKVSERFFTNRSGASVAYSADRGVIALQLARLTRASEFAPSDIAKALGKTAARRIGVIEAAGVVSEDTWSAVLRLQSLAPEARSLVEANALTRLLATAAEPLVAPTVREANEPRREDAACATAHPGGRPSVLSRRL